MKFLTLVAVLSLSLEASAQKRAEFDELQEKVCYEEARKVGCVKGTEPADKVCAQANKAKLPTKCHQIFGIE